MELGGSCVSGLPATPVTLAALVTTGWGLLMTVEGWVTTVGWGMTVGCEITLVGDASLDTTF